MSVRQAAALAALAGIGFCTGGCVVWDSARFERDVELVFTPPEGAGIAATTANGAVDIAEAERDDLLVRARIRATSQERADAVEILADTSDPDWIEVHAAWPTERGSSEGVSFRIEGPGGRPVRVRTGNGRVTATGFAGGADLVTSNGAVRAEGHDGPVDARTSNGSVAVLGGTERVWVETSNGSVRVELAPESAGPVDIDTSNGSVTLVVGPGFSGRVRGDTSNGSVRLEGDPAGVSMRLLDDGRTSKLVQFGESEEQSTIDTSNGSITVRVRR